LSEDGTKHVVIVGGGFAGVACAKGLADKKDVRVTLLDKNAYHQFQPLLYQVATAELTPDDIAFDLEDIFRGQENIEVRMAEVVSADPEARRVTLADDTTIDGDVVVLAAGSQPNFFHTPGAEEFAFPLYSLDDAKRIRSRVLQLFQDASERPELVDEGALTFVVVGGGATGVEAAGALAELLHNVMPHVHEHLAIAGARVILVDLGHTVLAPFSDEAHAYAAKQLQRRGVELKLGVSAKEIAADHVTLSDGTTLKTHLTVWGGGLMAAPLSAQSGVSPGRGGRLDVQPDLTVEVSPHVYALGDFANIPSGSDDALPQLGSVAQQAGDWAAQNIVAGMEGKAAKPFHYHDKGIMAMIGRKAAVAEVGEHRHELHGRIAFAAWLGVHAQLLANAGAEVKAFLAWADEFYVRPHHRSAALLDASNIDTPRIDWSAS
jgi:NADH dehydrogenase